MKTDDANLTVTLDADTRAYEAAMKAAQDSTRQFGNVFVSTIRSAVMSGKSLEDTLRSLALRMSTIALDKALAPVENALAAALNAAVAGAAGMPAYGKGGAFLSNGETAVPVTAFANGGIVNRPAMFAHGSGLGVMGEAGPEAILPLARGADGRLGVETSRARSVNVVFNVHTSDAASFRRSEGQVTAMLARAVQRGQRGM